MLINTYPVCGGWVVVVVVDSELSVLLWSKHLLKLRVLDLVQAEQKEK